MQRRPPPRPILLLTVFIIASCLPACAVRAVQMGSVQHELEAALRRPDDWYRGEQGRTFCDHLITWQQANGGWWKEYDLKADRPTDLPPPKNNAAPGDTEDQWRRTSTIDNGATYTEMRVLARAYLLTSREPYRDAFNRGLHFLFDAQYPNGGWPQRFPLQQNYGRHITFNDDAMTNVMRLLQEVFEAKTDFAFVSDADRQHARESFDRGVECILNCQIKVNGKLTAWCQQHDEVTLAPASARAYELPSITGGESSGIVLLLMNQPRQDERIRAAIDAAAAWYGSAKITGKRVQVVTGDQYEKGHDKVVVDDPSAPPLWARFYDLETGRPFFCSRDGVKRASLAEISWERRNGYAWYGNWGLKVEEAYAQWKKHDAPATATTRADAEGKHDSTSAVAQLAADTTAPAKSFTVAADGSGDFKTVQAAIDAVPAENPHPVVIEIKPGVYKEKLAIDRHKPMVTLHGVDADPAKTVLTNDWNASFVPPAATQPVGTSGSASTNVEATDFTAENLTFENSAGDKGQALALKTTGDRGVYRHCRFLGWQDTLCPDGGRQYFVDCYVEGRVDFIFGGSTAVFDHCTIKSKNGGYVTAARTSPDQKFGYVFLDCTLVGDGKPVPTYLGRPWQWDRGRRAAVAFIRCKMGPHIGPEGWNKWDLKNNPNTQPAQTTRYSEFASTDLDGKPLDVSKRAEWAKQLTPEQAAQYTVKNVLGGDDTWDPTTTGVSGR
jgi:pectinesterase